MNFYCFLCQIRIFHAFWIVMIATHPASKLQLVFSMFLQNIVLYYVYVWVPVWGLFKLSIVVVSTDRVCRIFSFLAAVYVDFLLFFSVFLDRNDAFKLETHHILIWNCFGHRKPFSSRWRNNFLCQLMLLQLYKQYLEQSTIEWWFSSKFHQCIHC